jgi:KDO2-lipid IV(A) lauroyltransferase
MTESRIPMRQNILWQIEATVYDAAEFIARFLPVDAVSDFGGWLLRLLGPLTGKHRVARTNLRLVFPDAPDAEIARLLRAQWEETGRTFAELPILDRIIADPTRVEVVGAERLAQIAADGESVVFISGHFSCFEVMSAVIVHAGVTCQITYRALNNPYVDERVRESRWRYGVRLFAPKGTAGARTLLRALGRGESVALMNDQKFNGGVAAPLFGVIAHTAPGPASFALKFGIPIQPMSVQRIHKARYRVIVHEPFYLEDTGDTDADIEAGVRRINAFIEERVLARPTEWFWVHRRWPGEIYRKKNS